MITSSVVIKGLTALGHLGLCKFWLVTLIECGSRRLSKICSALLMKVCGVRSLLLWEKEWGGVRQVEIGVKIVESVLGLCNEVLELVSAHALLIIVTIFH